VHWSNNRKKVRAPPTLSVRNWTKFQHYKDRTPPWIKLHYELLTSPDWVMIDDASKLLAVVCMLVASRNGGCVPNNPAYLRKVGQLAKLPSFKPLIDCGFLESGADASDLLADASPHACSRETETETDKEIETPIFPKSTKTPNVDQQLQSVLKSFCETALLRMTVSLPQNGEAGQTSNSVGTSPSAFATPDLGSCDTEAKILRASSNRRHRALQFDGHQRQALSGFGHLAQQSVVIFRPALVVI
jgi:hypothetical protein